MSLMIINAISGPGILFLANLYVRLCKRTQYIPFSLKLLSFSYSQLIQLWLLSLQFSSQLYLLFDFLSLLNHCNVWVMLSIIVLYCQMWEKKNNTIYHKQRFENLSYTSNDHVFSVILFYIGNCHKKILLFIIKKFKLCPDEWYIYRH